MVEMELIRIRSGVKGCLDTYLEMSRLGRLFLDLGLGLSGNIIPSLDCCLGPQV